jgi:uncharacterized repeat protein (TIGR03803 family)
MISQIYVRNVTAVWLGCAGACTPAAAATYTTLYNFTGLTDGDHPQCALIEDAQGNLFGTTAAGGYQNTARSRRHTGSQIGPKNGVVFELAPNGTQTVLHEFGIGADGANPRAGVITDAQGNMYGTTAYGGPTYNGTVFELTTSGTETVLHNFGGGTDGAVPSASLLSVGNTYYGTTSAGGSFGTGTVFQIGPNNAYSVLFTFNGTSAGGYPLGGLIADSAGNLYGTTSIGGSANYGVVFMLTPAGHETVLYNFKGRKDGNAPAGNLLRDKAGNLYGITYLGGKENYGTVFKLTQKGHEKRLHVFSGGSNDGLGPYGGLIMDAHGNLYGTTSQGGTYDFGTVFEMSPKGAITLLHSFSGTDGEAPIAPLMFDNNGNIFGTASLGGTTNSGVVFEITQ